MIERAIYKFNQKLKINTEIKSIIKDEEGMGN